MQESVTKDGLHKHYKCHGPSTYACIIVVASLCWHSSLMLSLNYTAL